MNGIDGFYNESFSVNPWTHLTSKTNATLNNQEEPVNNNVCKLEHMFYFLGYFKSIRVC